MPTVRARQLHVVTRGLTRQRMRVRTIAQISNVDLVLAARPLLVLPTLPTPPPLHDRRGSLSKSCSWLVGAILTSFGYAG